MIQTEYFYGLVNNILPKKMMMKMNICRKTNVINTCKTLFKSLVDEENLSDNAEQHINIGNLDFKLKVKTVLFSKFKLPLSEFSKNT